jgi:hypothetical protein
LSAESRFTNLRLVSVNAPADNVLIACSAATVLQRLGSV